jgi:hypothetical protein
MAVPASSSLPAQDARQVAKAFRTFQQTYAQDVRLLLLPAGTSDPSVNRPTFDQVVGAGLGALNASIDGITANLAAAPTLAATIRGELLGPDANSLQTLLAAIPTPAKVGVVTAGAFTSEGSQIINHVASTVTNQVKTSQGAAAGAAGTTVSQATTRQVLGQVGGAFRGFGQTYSSNVQTVLVPVGTVDASINRPTFDQAIARALNDLNANVVTALGKLPPSLIATLKPTVQNDLLNNGSNAGNNLQSRLLAIRSPVNARDGSLNAFRFASSLNISTAQNLLSRDILVAINQYTTSPTAK